MTHLNDILVTLLDHLHMAIEIWVAIDDGKRSTRSVFLLGCELIVVPECLDSIDRGLAQVGLPIVDVLHGLQDNVQVTCELCVCNNMRA